jgi:AraC-like DNA-binding protein
VLHSPTRISWDLRTPDLAVIRRSIARFLKPFSVEAAADGPYDARVCHRRLHRTELTLIDYGNSIRLDAGRMKAFHLVHIPLRGGYWFEADGERRHVGVGQAHIIRPDLHLRMSWSAGCQLLVLRTTDSRLAQCSTRLQSAPGEPNPGSVLCCTKGPGASLGRTIEFVTGELMEGGLLRTGSTAAATADLLLIGALVHAMTGAAASSREQHDHVALAQDYIARNLKADLSAAAIAAAAGVSSRSLFRAYRALYGTTPMASARNLRLQSVRTELQQKNKFDRTISRIASEWGFTHFGHFCDSYRRSYGETPTDTRRNNSY